MLQANGQTPGVPVGQCEQCGGRNMVPCTGEDFGGCYVNDGFILDEVAVCPPASLSCLRHHALTCHMSVQLHPFMTSQG